MVCQNLDEGRVLKLLVDNAVNHLAQLDRIMPDNHCPGIQNISQAYVTMAPEWICHVDIDKI